MSAFSWETNKVSHHQEHKLQLFQQLDETISTTLTKLAPSNCTSCLPQLDENKKENVSDNFLKEWKTCSLRIKKWNFFNWKKSLELKH